MSDLPPEGPPPAPPADPSIAVAAERAVEKAEAAATRRRWITLAEFVAVAGLLIGALGLWLNWSDRRADKAGKQAERSSEARIKSLVTLSGDVNSDGDTLTLTDTAHRLETVEVTFPAALGVRTHGSVLGPRISVDWFGDQLLSVTKDKEAGRLPVILTATYWDGDAKRNSSAIYDVVWRREGRLFGGHKVVLVRLNLRDRAATEAKLDAAWVRAASGGANES